MRCKNCGWVCLPEEKNCSKCGTPLENNPTGSSIPGSRRTMWMCPEGHAYDYRIYGDNCPFCPDRTEKNRVVDAGEIQACVYGGPPPFNEQQYVPEDRKLKDYDQLLRDYTSQDNSFDENTDNDRN